MTWKYRVHQTRNKSRHKRANQQTTQQHKGTNKTTDNQQRTNEPGEAAAGPDEFPSRNPAGSGACASGQPTRHLSTSPSRIQLVNKFPAQSAATSVAR